MLITQVPELLMIPFGVTHRRAFAQVGDSYVRFSFGPMFDERIPLDAIESAELASWPRWAGVGPRTNFRGVVGLVGSFRNVVRLTLKEPVEVRLFLVPISCRTLYLSLEHPDRFLEAIGAAPVKVVRAKAA
jgi:hypothetical protein